MSITKIDNLCRDSNYRPSCSKRGGLILCFAIFAAIGIDMPFKSSVERWRQTVTEERDKSKSFFDVDFILSLIHQESGGMPGEPGYTKAGDGSYALGLMQVIKSTLDFYNNQPKHKEKYTREQMAGTSGDDAKIQIRVGIWYLNHVRKMIVSQHEVATIHDLYLFSDCAYYMGFGGLSSKLEILADESKPIAYQYLQSRFPNWGQSRGNRPYYHSSKVWERFIEVKRQSGDSTIFIPPEPTPEPEPAPTIEPEKKSPIGLPRASYLPLLALGALLLLGLAIISQTKLKPA